MLKKALLGAVALLALVGHAEAEDLKEFRIGILGGENEADRLRNFQCLVDKLPAAIGVEKVSLFPASDYDGVVQGLLGGTLDYAELGASAYAKVVLADAKAIEPITTTMQTDGSTGYYSIMVARKDKGYKTIEDLKGKKTANSIGSTYMELGEQYGAEVNGVDTLGETLDLVKNGKVDATINAQSSFEDYMKNEGGPFIVVDEAAGTAYGIPLVKGDDNASLRAEINKALADMRDSGKLAELSVKYFGDDRTNP